MTDKTKIILLADDDPEDQEILEDALLNIKSTLKLVKVDSGKEAIDFLHTCSPSELPCLIILDYAMPVYNAAEVLELIGGQPHLQTIPKVVWSSSKQPEHVQTCIEKGARSYFVKPNKMSELNAIAQQMLDICD